MQGCGSSRVSTGASAICGGERHGVVNPLLKALPSRISAVLDLKLLLELRKWTRVGVVAVVASLQMVTPLGIWDMDAANAILYSPDTRVPRTPEVALRRAIPVVSSTMKAIQDPLENIFYLLRIPQRKPYGSMESDVKKALKLVVDDKDAILSTVPEDQRAKCSELYGYLLDDKAGLPALLSSIAEQDADKVSIKLASSLDAIAQIELLQAPSLPYLLPAQYQQYPRLTGRAVVEATVKKGDGTAFVVAAGQGPQELGTIEIVLDGYSAPITAGNFADKVSRGFYDGVKLRSTEQAVLSDSQRNDNIPMEILPAGEFQPLYKTTLNVQDGELPVLPLSVYGAAAMAHSSNAEDLSSASQFFFYLYDKRSAGLGGLSFEEGQFSVFGYVTKGRDLLSQLKTGDLIQSARLVSGAERLLYPPPQ